MEMSLPIPAISQGEAQAALDNAIGILQDNLPRYTRLFPRSCSKNGVYPRRPNWDWTNGFCTGTYWLAYEATKRTEFQEAALRQVNSFARRIRLGVNVNHHDMGFLYTPSCVAAYRLCSSATGRRAALLAADKLLSRYQPKGSFIQAWGQMGKPSEYRMIIDCLLNLPLLYWASDETGNPAFARTATDHLENALHYLFRPDGSSFHTFYFDPATGVPLHGATRQGYCDDSTWARGQAWGIYGLALAYRHTRNKDCINQFYPVANYYLSHLPEDMVPFWDLSFSADSGEPRDSSAAAIAACGLLEMAQYLQEEQAARYIDAAKQMAASLAKSYSASGTARTNGLLLHGVYTKKSPYNGLRNVGVDECNLWGDYFWMELLVRLTTNWNPYW